MCNRLFIVILLLALSTLACSLTAEPPATLPPRTPLSTITPQGALAPQYTIAPKPGLNQSDSPVLVAPTDVAINLQVETSPSSLAEQVVQVDSNRMWNTINNMVGFHNRHALSKPAPDKGIHAAAEYLLSELYKIQAQNPDVRIDVSRHNFLFEFGEQEYTGDNIMLVINGTDGDAGVVLAGAHYDTISRFNAYNTTSFQPSADDNGSGVAAILEMARIMAQTPHRATVIFVFFSAEELDRLGSIALVEEYLKLHRIPLKAALSLDTIGSPIGPDGKRHDGQMRVFSAPPNTSTSRQLARQIEFVARYFVPGMKVNVEDALDRPGRWGDHSSFSGEDGSGYAAVRLIEQADDPNRGDTDRDTVDRIDLTYLSGTTQVALATMLVLADGPLPPQNITVDPTNWRIQWNASQGAQSYVLALRRSGSLVYDTEVIVESTGFAWPDVVQYEALAVAAIDNQGRIGPFSLEVLVPRY